jgi:ribosomal protein S18 acetylase RimI-like enzyme
MAIPTVAPAFGTTRRTPSSALSQGGGRHEDWLRPWHHGPLMLIGPLSPDHHQAAVDLWLEAGLARPWNDPVADLNRALQGASSSVLGGTEGGVLVATAMVGHDGHRGWVYYLAVRRDSRGRGHARAIMGACEAWLIARKVPKLNLMVRDDNAEARDFYGALGYMRDEVVVLSRRLSGSPES